jgi:hypothetical protein
VSPVLSIDTVVAFSKDFWRNLLTCADDSGVAVLDRHLGLRGVAAIQVLQHSRHKRRVRQYRCVLANSGSGDRYSDSPHCFGVQRNATSQRLQIMTIPAAGIDRRSTCVICVC